MYFPPRGISEQIYCSWRFGKGDNFKLRLIAKSWSNQHQTSIFFVSLSVGPPTLTNWRVMSILQTLSLNCGRLVGQSPPIGQSGSGGKTQMCFYLCIYMGFLVCYISRGLFYFSGRSQTTVSDALIRSNRPRFKSRPLALGWWAYLPGRRVCWQGEDSSLWLLHRQARLLRIHSELCKRGQNSNGSRHIRLGQVSHYLTVVMYVAGGGCWGPRPPLPYYWIYWNKCVF